MQKTKKSINKIKEKVRKASKLQATYKGKRRLTKRKPKSIKNQPLKRTKVKWRKK